MGSINRRGTWHLPTIGAAFLVASAPGVVIGEPDGRAVWLSAGAGYGQLDLGIHGAGTQDQVEGVIAPSAAGGYQINTSLQVGIGWSAGYAFFGPNKISARSLLALGNVAFMRWLWGRVGLGLANATSDNPDSEYESHNGAALLIGVAVTPIHGRYGRFGVAVAGSYSRFPADESSYYLASATMVTLSLEGTLIMPFEGDSRVHPLSLRRDSGR